MSKIIKLISLIGICLGVGALGSISTVSSIPTWYAALNKPSFSPPNWLFGPAWTILYILMGVSLYLVIKNGIKTEVVRKAVILFATQLFLNAIWSPIFFGVKNIFLAFIVIAVLWVYIIKTIFAFRKINKTASLLLYPYIAWVTFASALNYSVWILNR